MIGRSTREIDSGNAFKSLRTSVMLPSARLRAKEREVREAARPTTRASSMARLSLWIADHVAGRSDWEGGNDKGFRLTISWMLYTCCNS